MFKRAEAAAFAWAADDDRCLKAAIPRARMSSREPLFRTEEDGTVAVSGNATITEMVSFWTPPEMACSWNYYRWALTDGVPIWTPGNGSR
ncbi:hypothetical protein M8818_005417 [Zalaria obscura]|uniref:Uncharacterized protein n=1 Tax=Zalaria obscura TaxID=2024903 RepID=A0ACC3S803_9PEZI